MNAESPVWSELKVVERKLAGLVIATVAGVLFTPFVYREMRQFDDGERIPVRTIVLCVIGGIVIFLFIGIMNFGWFREYLQ